MRLNLNQMWRLYSLLKPAIENRDREEQLIDEITEITTRSTPQVLLECIRIMYDNKVEFTSPFEFNTMFAKGLVENEFFSFCDIMRGLNGITKQ